MLTQSRRGGGRNHARLAGGGRNHSPSGALAAEWAPEATGILVHILVHVRNFLVHILVHVRNFLVHVELRAQSRAGTRAHASYYPTLRNFTATAPTT